MKTFSNPVLQGFNPDPCILRVEDTYYIFVSTFEWLPGIRVYTSKNLFDWKYKTSILDTKNQINLQGNPKACSIWAPSAIFKDGIFYVVFTNVKSTRVPYKDVDNYIITAKDIEGPWSEPVYINSSGFDPSLFIDSDGQAYFLNEIWDYRLETHNKSDGIVMQKIDLNTFILEGEPKVIFKGTEARKTEAPQMYYHNDYYYLLTAEGGTELGHQETVVRSKHIWGPYMLAPNTPLISAKDKSDSYLQCAGHASLVESAEGNWFIAYLCTRPTNKEGFSILGRETAVEQIEWTDDGWPKLANGTNYPSQNRLTLDKTNQLSFRDSFTEIDLNHKYWNTLRILPNNSWLSQESSGIRIRGGQSPQSVFDQHLIGTRQTAFNCNVEFDMQYKFRSYLQLAGVTLYLDIENYLLFMVTVDNGKPVIVVQQSVKGEFKQLKILPIINDCGNYHFRLEIRNKKVTVWLNKQQVIAHLDIDFLAGGYTGNFIGLDVIDMERRNLTSAVFSDFEYTAIQ
ncbi:glycoside hydrolase family 43 protein [Latilactobacillus sakei]|uniref:Glycoside hydrolase family 43 protein n=1 Tax=Latilactobacillus sakei TaxID=1599 RepID=A0AAF0K5S4_LATSK|nr:glycoside hydrolase family 43 protein [Latilactobacillus sakei]EOR85054.1 beta-xylosidase [Latilactobacillus sakei subsp. sakei LS25]PKX62527.1 glycoside hydrolase family 43 protein [Latilactobacillus sakei]PKX67757.1 glycoside hydrolase family 43 protein [Latilactobacillus sakei]WGI19983.1 glycoside hydrolase family 43 protein [Latilactobacillus sakei]